MQTSIITIPDVENLYHFESIAISNGFQLIAGIDEAGRGPLAGPVVASAVILDPCNPVDGVNDSKKLSEKRRESIFEKILTQAVAIGIGIVDHTVIDRINILQATRQAMLEAVESLTVQPDFLLIDGITRISSNIPQQTIKSGDSLSASIAAASIIAKVTRDRLMLKLDREFPQYGFAANKGYGSKKHLAALQQYGCCPVHRKTFAGVCGKPLYKNNSSQIAFSL